MTCCPQSSPQMYDVLERARHMQDCPQDACRVAQQGSAACSLLYQHLPIWCNLSNTLHADINPPKVACMQHSRAEVPAAD